MWLAGHRGRRGAGWTRGPGLPVSCSCFLFVQFHYENTRAQFFVEDASTASALKAVNYKILDQENRRVCIKSLALLVVGLGPGAWAALASPEFTCPPCFPQISIIINSSAPPHSVQNELKPEQVEQLKVRQAPVTCFHPSPPSVLHSPSDPLTPLPSPVADHEQTI